MIDTSILKSKMVLKGYSVSKLANELGSPRTYLSSKINNSKPFTYEDIMQIRKLLNLSNDELVSIFFTPVVDKMESYGK